MAANGSQCIGIGYRDKKEQINKKHNDNVPCTSKCG